MDSNISELPINESEYLPKFCVSAENCEYRGEGNNNLVIRLKQERKIIRLLKNVIIKENGTVEEIGDISKRLNLQMEYTRNVMKPLLGSFVLDPVLIKLSSEDIRTINKLVEGCRPNNRKHRTVKEQDSIAVVLPDFCALPESLSHFETIGPVLGIEIKPKQGFLFENSVCKFCMKQIQKVNMELISCPSGYCPLDLFSGCPTRMNKAINELLKNPDNNLRIFQNQEIVFSSDKRNYKKVLQPFIDDDSLSPNEYFSHLVTQSLLSVIYETEDISDNPQQFCSNLIKTSCLIDGDCSHCLPTGCILQKILKLQLYGKIKVKTVLQYWKELSVVNSFPDLNLQNYFKDGFAATILPDYAGLVDQHPLEHESHFKARKVWEFLVFLTLADCSVIITLQKIQKTQKQLVRNVIYDLKGWPYLLSIAPIDLDPKPISNIEKNFLENSTMLTDYMNFKKKS